MGDSQLGFPLCVFRKTQDFKQSGGPFIDRVSPLLVSVLSNLSRLSLNSSCGSYTDQPLQLEMDRRRNEEGFIDLKIKIER